MDEIILLGIILIIVSVIGEYFLRRKLKVSKTEKMSVRAGRVENSVVAILVVSFLLIYFSIITKNEDVNPVYIILPFFYLVSLFRAFMEWHYNRQARRWAIEIYQIGLLTLIFTAIQFWMG